MNGSGFIHLKCLGGGHALAQRGHVARGPHRGGVAPVVYCLLLITLTACGAQDSTPSPAPARPRAAEASPDQPRSRYVGVDLYILPLDSSLEPAWDALKTRGLDETAVALWRENGFDIALAEEPQVRAFMGALPEVSQHRAQVQTLSNEWSRLITSPPLDRPLPIVWTSPGGEVTNQRLVRGRLQLLIRVETNEDDEGETREILTVMPHHHLVRPSVRPRTPQELAIEGRRFEELALRIPSPPGPRWLIVGLHPNAHPPPPPPEVPPEAPPEVPLEENADDDEGEAESPTGEPEAVWDRKLAWPLLTGTQFQKRRMIVAVISISRWEGAPAAENTPKPQ